MIRNTIAVVLLSLGSMLSHASLKLYPRTQLDGFIPPTRALTIFLDDTEYPYVGSNTYEAIAAFYQQASPILISYSIMNNMLTQLELTAEEKKQEEAAAKLGRAGVSVDDADHIISYRLKKHFIQNFNPHDWLLYQVNRDLFLFIPNAYIKSLGTLPQPTKKYSSRELLLGLKIDHMTALPFETLQKLARAFADNSSEDEASVYFQQALYSNQPLQTYNEDYSTIFITSRAYENKKLIPQWVIYLAGHGSLPPEATVSGLSVPSLKYFLSFLNTKIITKILIYSSCYSAGVSLESAFKQSPENPIPDSYHFPLVTAGVGNLTTVTSPFYTKEAQQQAVFNVNFALFFKYTMSDTPHVYEHFLPYVISGLNYLLPDPPAPHSSPTILEAYNPENFPLIRPAERDLFIPLVPVLHISPLMLATRIKPLDIFGYVSLKNAITKRLYIMIDVDHVPFDLILRRSAMTPIFAPSFSNHPDPAIIHLRALYSEYNLEELFKAQAFIGDPHTTPFFINTFVNNQSQQKYSSVIISIDEDGLAYAQAIAPDSTLHIIKRTKEGIRYMTPDEQSTYIKNLATLDAQPPAKKVGEQVHKILQVATPLKNQLLLDAIANLDIQAVVKFLETHKPFIDETVMRRLHETRAKDLNKKQSETLSRIEGIIAQYLNPSKTGKGQKASRGRKRKELDQ